MGVPGSPWVWEKGGGLCFWYRKESEVWGEHGTKAQQKEKWVLGEKLSLGVLFFFFFPASFPRLSLLHFAPPPLPRLLFPPPPPPPCAVMGGS